MLTSSWALLVCTRCNRNCEIKKCDLDCGFDRHWNQWRGTPLGGSMRAFPGRTNWEERPSSRGAASSSSGLDTEKSKGETGLIVYLLNFLLVSESTPLLLMLPSPPSYIKIRTQLLQPSNADWRPSFLSKSLLDLQHQTGTAAASRETIWVLDTFSRKTAIAVLPSPPLTMWANLTISFIIHMNSIGFVPLDNPDLSDKDILYEIND